MSKSNSKEKNIFCHPYDVHKTFTKPKSSTTKTQNSKTTSPPSQDDDISIKIKLTKGQKKNLAAKRKRAQKNAEKNLAERFGERKIENKKDVKIFEHFGYAEGDDATTRVRKDYLNGIAMKIIDPANMEIIETRIRLDKVFIEPPQKM